MVHHGQDGSCSWGLSSHRSPAGRRWRPPAGRILGDARRKEESAADRGGRSKTRQRSRSTADLGKDSNLGAQQIRDPRLGEQQRRINLLQLRGSAAVVTVAPPPSSWSLLVARELARVFPPDVLTRGGLTRGNVGEGPHFPLLTERQMGLWGYPGQIRPGFFHPRKRPGSRDFPLLPNEP